MSEQTEPRFTVVKDGRKWFVVDGTTGERLDGAVKTKHLAQVEADQANADAEQDEAVGPTPQPDPEKVAKMLELLDEKVAADQANVDAFVELLEDAMAGQALTADQIAALNPTERIKLAKAEVTATHEWVEAGRVGQAPARTVLDWMANPNKARKAVTARKVTSARTPEQDARVVQVITDERAAGKSWGAIAKTIEAEGIPTSRGGQWYDTTVSDLAKKLGLDNVSQAVATPA